MVLMASLSPNLQMHIPRPRSLKRVYDLYSQWNKEDRSVYLQFQFYISVQKIMYNFKETNCDSEINPLFFMHMWLLTITK